MRFMLVTASLAALASCGQPPADPVEAAGAPAAVAAAAAPTGQSSGIDGWEIDMTAYAKIGSALPAFAGKLADNTEITAEALRGHWTIIGVWTDAAVPPDETTFVSALNSAVDQDPDLDLLMIHRKPEGAAAPAHAWPTLMDEGPAIASLALPAAPAYLLVGPDLTIEGYRGALTATPDDGIKSVIRGVAEIRKQVAAPQ
jgi:hypothetical protein